MIKPIPTFWNGRYFRSRAEARWAVFFDELWIGYEYEKEGYDLGNGIRYLPDFWLTELKFWVEVKAELPDDTAMAKASRLASNLGIPVYMAVEPIGNVRPWPPAGTRLSDYNYGDDPPQHIAFFGDNGDSYQDNGYFWTLCPSCSRIGIEYQGRSHRLCRCTAGAGKEGREESRCEELVIAYACALTESFDRPRPTSQLRPTGSLG